MLTLYCIVCYLGEYTLLLLTSNYYLPTGRIIRRIMSSTCPHYVLLIDPVALCVVALLHYVLARVALCVRSGSIMCSLW
jgi:hypothetical protein